VRLARTKLWTSIEGAELQWAFGRGESLVELVGSSAAIYLWRLNLAPPGHVVQNAHQMSAWIAECLSIPLAELPAVSLAHFLHLRGIAVGGGSLSDAKRQMLKEWLQEPGHRQWMRGFLASLSEIVPPLYVGEADNLARRVRDHLRGDTDFAEALEGKLKLSWDKLTFWYCVVPANLSSEDKGAKELRTLLEMLIARLALAGWTIRPG
jgi:hypothetical protein